MKNMNIKSRAGNKNPNWKGGISLIKEYQREVNKRYYKKYPNRIKEYQERWIIKRFGSKKNYYHEHLKSKQTTGRPYGKHITPLVGDKNPNWKGGVSSENERIRNSEKYILWRKLVFERDGYKCQICKKIGGNLNAHHIKSFSEYPELRFDVNNGITLCKDCHNIETSKQMVGNNYAKNNTKK